MKYAVIALTVILTLNAHAQKRQASGPEVFASTITAEDLKKHLYIIAGPEMEGRETASEGQRKAAAYIENEFRALGLKPGNGDSYQMHYPVFRDSVIKSSIAINGKLFEHNKDFWLNPASNYSATLHSGEIVFAGYGLQDSSRNDYAQLDVRGKIVLVLQKPQPAPVGGTGGGGGRRIVLPSMQIAEAALKNGAAALLILQDNPVRRMPFANGNAYVNGFRKTFYPNTFLITDTIAAAIMGNDLEQAKAALASGALFQKTYPTQATLEFQKTTQQTGSSNVIALLEGKDLKDEYLVLTAHYDHLGIRDGKTIYYGADDDGSGTVTILELAQAFVKAREAGKGPRRNIIFMTVSGEEKGLWGSAHYADHPVFPLEKTTANLNIDMIGRIDPKRKNGDSTNYVYVVGDDKLSSDLKPISESINSKYTRLELDYKYNDPKDPERIYYRSDHFNFARKGVPVLFYFNGTHADYHRPTDTPDKIDYPQMTRRARLVFHTAWEIANRDAMLKRDIPLDVQFR